MGATQTGCPLPRGFMALSTSLWDPRILTHLGGEGRSIWPRGSPEGTRGQQEWSARGGCCHVQQWVIDKHDFAEVELVGEPLPFGLVENPLVVVVAVDGRRTLMLGAGPREVKAGPLTRALCPAQSTTTWGN